MSIKARFLKGGLQIGLGQIGQQLVLLARNIIIARLLLPEEFGLALTLVTVISALDALSELGTELYLVRSPRGDDPALEATLHSMLVVRGIIGAMALLLAAHPVALLFSAPEATWAYQLLAVLPLIRGFLHLDYRRFERTMRFMPGILTNFTAAAVGSLVAIVAAFLTHDFSAMLFGSIAQTLAMVVMSHGLAERPYRLASERDDVKGLLSYGGPLILNGILLYTIGQGDRIVIGAALGMRDLAVYGAATILSGGVSLLVLRVTGGLYLPLLSGMKPDDPGYLRRYEFCGAISTMMALGSLAVFALMGDWLVRLVFGANYATPPFLMAAVAARSCFVIFRSWPQIGFLSSGHTGRLLAANIIAALGLPIAYLAVSSGLGVVAVSVGYALAETAAALFSVIGVARSDWALTLLRLKFFLVLLGITLVLVAVRFLGVMPAAPLAQIAAVAVAVALGAGAIVAASPPVYVFLTTQVRARLARP